MDTQSDLLSPSTETGSSRTGLSDKSALSEDARDRDFTKDNAASPIDLECHIQNERITKILDEAIYKTKLALCLPQLVQEYRTLSTALSSSHMEDLVFIFEQYDNPLFSSSLFNVGAFKGIKSKDFLLKERLNPELGHLIYIMNSYPALKPKVEEMVQRMKETATNNGKCPLNLQYLLVLEQFRDQTTTQMSQTAAEELLSKITTRKLEASNASLIEKIKENTKILNEESEHFNKSMAIRMEMINKLERELAMLNIESNNRLKKQIIDSERQMVLATRSHVVKNEMLKEVEMESKEAYENLLQVHLVEEKNQRARRFKVETQLLSWLQKYDLDMGEKQAELDEYTEMYENELKKCSELELKIAEQDKEYIPLMAEREEEYHQEMTEKLNKFMIEHAARVIQHAWREVLANRAEKKRLRKLQKKMQEAEELAKRKAQIAAAAAAAAAKKEAAAAKKQAAEDKKAALEEAKAGKAGTQTERTDD